MPIGITEEHEALRQSARRWLESRCPPSVARALLDAEAETMPPFWAELAAQGWLGLHVPEARRSGLRAARAGGRARGAGPGRGARAVPAHRAGGGHRRRVRRPHPARGPARRHHARRGRARHRRPGARRRARPSRARARRRRLGRLRRRGRRRRGHAAAEPRPDPASGVGADHGEPARACAGCRATGRARWPRSWWRPSARGARVGASTPRRPTPRCASSSAGPSASSRR